MEDSAADFTLNHFYGVITHNLIVHIRVCGRNTSAMFCNSTAILLLSLSADVFEIEKIVLNGMRIISKEMKVRVNAGSGPIG